MVALFYNMAKQNASSVEINQGIIFRTPQLPVIASLADSWEVLKASIRLSSPAFYAEIENVASVDLKTLPAKKQFTIQKYFNRARYRATPYGSFASVGIFENGKGAGTSLVLDHNQQIHRFTDWPLKDQYRVSSLDMRSKNVTLLANSSCYTIRNNIRYVYRGEKNFELSDILRHDIIQQVLDACHTPIRLLALEKKLDGLFGDTAAFDHTVESLVNIQLLFCELQPNIIGQDYFKRIQFFPPDETGYIIARRSYKKGSISENIFRHLPQLCELLTKIPQKNEETPLIRFIRRFQKRYDQQAISIMQVLDPEIGIGYEHMEQVSDPEGIVQDFLHSEVQETTNPLKLFLAGALPLAGTKDDDTVIRLENWKPPQTLANKRLPNSFSALVSIAGDLVQIESMGGCTANALAGRFTIGDEQIHKYCRQVAEQEQKTNPEILFFDIGYISEAKVDNVNRRKCIYNYQLTIGNFDTSQEPLSLSDMMLFVRNNTLMLWSKKYNKRMIPRLASAYNYTRSDLPLFRLLCDLQHQGLFSQLSVKLRNLMPSFRFYPRIQYHNLILSPAAWKVEWKSYKDLGSTMSLYLKKMNIAPFVRTGAGDQTLCFDIHSEQDLILMEQILEREKEVYLEETIAPQSTYAQDENGDHYAAQLLLTLQHHVRVYEGIQPSIEGTKNSAVCYPPGSEWLYFELYMHPRQTDRILKTYILPWLERIRHFARKWFFIRYNENGDHLRIRVQIGKQNAPLDLLKDLTEKITPEIDGGIIADMQLKTYYPESERYRPHLMAIVEEHFMIDSEYILAIIGASLLEMDKYHICVDLLLEVRLSGIVKLDAFEGWLYQVNENWENEHKLSTADFKKLNQHYRKFQTVADYEFGEIFIFKQKAFLFSLLNTLQKEEPSQRIKLLGDLMHMHINRLFSQHQRLHEMIIYYFLNKVIVKKKYQVQMEPALSNAANSNIEELLSD